MGILARLQLGLRRHPFRFLAEAGLVFGALWTALDAIDNAFPHVTVDSPSKLGILLGVCIVTGLIRAIPSSSSSHRIGGSNSRFTVRFGDLFAEPGVRVIPVNEFFDSALGEHVSPNTLHGQFITRVFGGQAHRFNADVDKLLPAGVAEPVGRESGRDRRFPLGTSVQVSYNAERYLLLALARTDITTRKAHASVQDMWSALDGLWAAARTHSNGDSIVLPLIGSGQSGVGLAPQLLLHLIAMSAIAETKRQRIAKEIVVVIQEQFFPDVDLRALDELMR